MQLDVHLHDGPVRGLRRAWRTLLRRQYLHQRLLLCRHLPRRGIDLLGSEQLLHLGHMHLGQLHVRQLGPALLPVDRVPDRHGLLKLQPGLHLVQQHLLDDIQLYLPDLWQGRRTVLHRQHLHRHRNAMPVRLHVLRLQVQGLRRHRPALLLDLDLKLHRGVQGQRHRVPVRHQLKYGLYVQAVRRHRPALLHDLDHKLDGGVSGQRHGLQHHDQHLSGLRQRWRALLRRQYLQRHVHDLQQLPLRGLRHAGNEPQHGAALLRGQHLHERMLRHPLRRQQRRQPGVRGLGRGLRQLFVHHHQPDL